MNARGVIFNLAFERSHFHWENRGDHCLRCNVNL